VPTFKLRKRNLVHYAGFPDHCSFFPGSAATTDTIADELGKWRTGRGTIQFTVEEPLSADLVTRIVKARLAEEASRHRK